jgi:hypothetical protein
MWIANDRSFTIPRELRGVRGNIVALKSFDVSYSPLFLILSLFSDENKNARRQCDKVEQEDGWTQI